MEQKRIANRRHFELNRIYINSMEYIYNKSLQPSIPNKVNSVNRYMAVKNIQFNFYIL